MENIILIAVVLIIICAAVLYVYRAKKSGQTCVGCPHSKQCSGHKCTCSNTDN